MGIDKKHYSILIRNSETRFISYKQLLNDLFKSKKLYREDDFEWMRIFLRDLKNIEERFLKMLINEWTEIKQDNGY